MHARVFQIYETLIDAHIKLNYNTETLLNKVIMKIYGCIVVSIFHYKDKLRQSHLILIFIKGPKTFVRNLWFIDQ